MCEEGVDFMLNLPQVKDGAKVGLVGISKAVEVQLSMAAFLPEDKIGSVVAMNGVPNQFISNVDYKGERVLNGLPLDPAVMAQHIKQKSETVVNIHDAFDPIEYEGHDSTIPFYNKKSIKYLFICAHDDQNYDCVRSVSLKN